MDTFRTISLVVGPILLLIGIIFLVIGLQEKHRATYSKFGKKLMGVFTEETPGMLIKVGLFFITLAVLILSPIGWRAIF